MTKTGYLWIAGGTMPDDGSTVPLTGRSTEAHRLGAPTGHTDPLLIVTRKSFRA